MTEAKLDIWNLDIQESIKCFVAEDGTIYYNSDLHCYNLSYEGQYIKYTLKDKRKHASFKRLCVPCYRTFEGLPYYKLDIIKDTIKLTQLTNTYKLNYNTKMLNVNNLSVELSKTTVNYEKYFNLSNIVLIDFQEDKIIFNKMTEIKLPQALIKQFKAEYEAYNSKS